MRRGKAAAAGVRGPASAARGPALRLLAPWAKGRLGPTSGPFASTRCRGVYFALTDPVAFSPLDLAAALATSLLRLHRDDWQPAPLDTLLLHQPSLAALLAGHDDAALRERWRSDQAPFLARREPFLLYP